MTECENCKRVIKLKGDVDLLPSKYKEHIICNGCKDVLQFIGFLGDVKNPLIVYEQEKVKLDYKKMRK